MMLCLILINDVLINVTNFGSCQEGFFFLVLSQVAKTAAKVHWKAGKWSCGHGHGAVMWSKKDWLINIDKDVNKLDPKNSDEMDFICSW